jgi:hypothetical protein
MRPIGIAALFLASILTTMTLNAGAGKQAPQPFKVTKDAQAMTVAATAFTAMGGTQAFLTYQDALASGTYTSYLGGTPSSYPIVFKSKGTQETRVELQKEKGTNVRIVNTGQGVLEKPDGTFQSLATDNTLAERVF